MLFNNGDPKTPPGLENSTHENSSPKIPFRKSHPRKIPLPG